MSIHQAAARFGTLALLVAGGTLPASAQQAVTLDELSEKINEAFAEIVLAVIDSEPAIRGVYSTGGDITAAIHRQSGTVALRLEEEIVPLAGFGQVQGGKIDGLVPECIRNTIIERLAEK